MKRYLGGWNKKECQWREDQEASSGGGRGLRCGSKGLAREVRYIAE